MTATFDASRCSFGVQLTGKRTAKFVGQVTNSLVFLSKHFADLHVKKKVDVKFTLTFGPQAEPILGVFHTKPDLDDLWLKGNPCVSYLNLITGQLFVRGSKMYDTRLPPVQSGATVDLSLTSDTISIEVKNPGKALEEGSCKLQGISEEDLNNFFLGALQTGRKQIRFDLLTNDKLSAEHSQSSEPTFKNSQGVITVSKDCKLLTRSAMQQGNGYALLDVLLKTGIHYVKFCITSDFGASLCIGVARYPFRLSEEYVKDPMKHIYRHPGLLLWRSYRGLSYYDGKQQDITTEALGWQHGNTIYIELVVNMEERTIEVLKNDISLGIVFTDIPEVVQPVVCFYASYEKAVKLVSYRSTGPAPTPPLPIAAPAPASLDSSVIPKSAKFDFLTKTGLMTITKNNMTVFREKNQAGNSLCYLDVTCAKNCFYRFSFVIENDQGASVCVGVTDVLDPKNIRLTGIGNIYSSPHLSVFRSFQGMLYEKGRELPKHLEEYWMTGTLLEMMIDIDDKKATVQYAINGNDQGIAFSGIRPPVRPLVAFYAGMEKRITLIHFEATPKKVVLRDSPAMSIPNRFTRLIEPERLKKLQIIMRTTEPLQWCTECGNPVDCLALPCGDMLLCAKHLCERGQCPCGRYPPTEFKMWNLF